MKKLLLTFLMFGSFSVFAEFTMEAKDIVDLGDTVQVVDPMRVGCASGQCYGGSGFYELKARLSGRKICKELGFGKYVKNSKVVERMSGVFYDAFTYRVLFRNGPPGWPESVVKRGIKSLECYKKRIKGI